MTTPEVPQLLQELVQAGRWPRNVVEANAQNLKPLVTAELVRRLAPEESTIYLLPPPFHTVREKSKDNTFWNSAIADPDGIDFDLALDIGDFGLGSDAPILLDYRKDAMNPRVVRLRWSVDGGPNKWIIMSQDFASFTEALGL